MKTISAGLRTHLDGTVTSLATVWRITRTDGTNFFFTDHDVDVIFDDGDGSQTYTARTGYNRTAVANNVGLSVDNLDLEGVFDSADIKEDEIRAGLFDFAEVKIQVVNWKDTSQGGLKMRRGRLGEVVATEQGIFRAELRGLSQQLSQSILEVYQAECRVDLGDTRCKVPIDPPLIARATAYVVGDFLKVITTAGSTQERFENRIYECTTAGMSLAVQPTYDTTVDNTTEERIAATGVLTLTGNALDTETVTIDTKVYTFQTVLTDVDGNVLIGASASDSIDNLIAAIVLGAGAGTLYATSTTLHPTVTAAAGAGDTMDATAKTKGTVGNSIATTETLTNGSWANATLTGGVDGPIFTARQAWMRHADVDVVTDTRVFTLTNFTDARAVDDWFNGGALEFEDGQNDGKVIEIRDWVAGSSEITLFLPAPFTILTGAKVRLYPGCDKRSVTCSGKFQIPGSLDFDAPEGNILNLQAEPFVPGQDALSNIPDAR